MMHISRHVSLTNHSTMRLGGLADYLVTIDDKHELVNAIKWAQERKLAFKVIGSGSNIVWSDDGFKGLVIVNAIPGYELRPENKEYFYLTVGAGENWDSVVDRSVKAGLHGIEALSLIPGTAGATPLQNVGAYGQEVAQTLVSIEAYDTKAKRFIMLAGDDCGFGYRTSRFKTTDAGRFAIIELIFYLRRINPRPPFYPAVATYLREHHKSAVTPQTIRNAVIAIRSAKLPDPSKIANNGSFFANPIVTKSFYGGLAKRFPQIPHWEMPRNKVKLSAAWLIENAGFKDFHDRATGMATWPHQPLVIVNEKATSTTDLLKFRDKIAASVEKKFGVKLQQEPELVP